MRLQSVKLKDTTPETDEGVSSFHSLRSIAMEQNLNTLGLNGLGAVHVNLTAAQLYEHALRRGEVKISEDGAIMAVTGQHTGRSPNDKYIVQDAMIEQDIDWGKANQPLEPEAF